MNPTQITVTVENLAPQGGQPLSPLWFGIHDGSFDLFDAGSASSEALEFLAEDGLTGALPTDLFPPSTLPIPRERLVAGEFDRSEAAQNGGVQSTVADVTGTPFPGIAPADTASTTITLDGDAATNQYFSYASMPALTNDAFIGNDDPTAIEIFDSEGNFTGADFVVSGDQVWDAGTEVNDEKSPNVPFTRLLQGGIDENGVVKAHPDLLPPGEGGIVDYEFNGQPVAENADFTAEGYQVARITITASDEPFADSEDSSLPILGTAGNDVFDAADSGDGFDGNGDILFTQLGDDIVDASQALIGGNKIAGGPGDDKLFAGTNDLILGGPGDDILNAILGGTDGGSNNRFFGQDGNDTLFAGQDGRLVGGNGDDSFFITFGGDNLLTGDSGSDAFWVALFELPLNNTITDFELGADVIGIGGVSGVSSVEDLEFRQVGDDAVISFSGSDFVTLLNTQASGLQSNGTFVFL